MRKESLLGLLAGIEFCLAGKHDLAELLAANGLWNCSQVARWCRRCGSAVVDGDYDGRTNAGQVMRMRSSEFLKQAIAAIHRQLLGELLTKLRASLARRLFARGYDIAKLVLAAQGGAPISEALAAKVRFLATVVRHLEGGYDNEGMNAWFDRPRVQLGGRSPAQILTESWEPMSKDAQSVLELAHSLSSSPAT